MAPNLTAPRRTRGSSKLQVWLAASEVEQWTTDESFRDKVLEAMRARAREKGRKYVEIFDGRGELLRAGSA